MYFVLALFDVVADFVDGAYGADVLLEEEGFSFRVRLVKLLDNCIATLLAPAWVSEFVLANPDPRA